MEQFTNMRQIIIKLFSLLFKSLLAIIKKGIEDKELYML